MPCTLAFPVTCRWYRLLHFRDGISYIPQEHFSPNLGIRNHPASSSQRRAKGGSALAAMVYSGRKSGNFFMDAAPSFAVKIYGYCFLKFCFAVKSLLFTVPMGIPSFFAISSWVSSSQKKKCRICLSFSLSVSKVSRTEAESDAP